MSEAERPLDLVDPSPRTGVIVGDAGGREASFRRRRFYPYATASRSRSSKGFRFRVGRGKAVSVVVEPSKMERNDDEGVGDASRGHQFADVGVAGED